MSGVYVGWLDDGECQGTFTESLLGMIVPGCMNRVIRGWIRYETGPVLDRARNELAERFLRTDGEWLLSIDSDMIFQPDLADRLLEHADPEERPIVSPVCYGITSDLGVFPSVFGVGELGFYVRHDLPVDQLVRVDGVGAACTLIHRTALERIGEVGPGRWYDHLMLRGKPIGEDLSFCVRAAAAGIPIWVHTGIPIRHLKIRVAIDEPYYRQWRMSNGPTP